MTTTTLNAPAPAAIDREAWEGALQAYRFALDAKQEGHDLDYRTTLTNLIATPAPNAYALRLKMEAMFADGDLTPERRRIVLDDLMRIDTEDTTLTNAWRDYTAALIPMLSGNATPTDIAAGNAKMEIADTVLLNMPARTVTGAAAKLRRALAGLHNDRFARLALQRTDAELAEKLGEIDDTPARLIVSAILTLDALG